MVKLSNGARVLAEYIVKQDSGGHPHGVVLAETDTDFVTWNVWEGDATRCIYEAETGHYFHKRGPMQRGDDRQQAEIDFGQRLAMLMPANVYEGLRQSCGGV